MTTDTFTASDGTALSAHTAAGITWGGLDSGVADGVINDGAAGGNEVDVFTVRARATNLSGDFAQITLKGGNYPVPSKSIHVRCGAAAKGYQVQVSELSGDTITHLYLLRNEGFLTAAVITGLSKSRLTDHTLAVRATTVGGGVEIRAYIDGTQVTWADTEPGNETPGTVFLDPTANTPITSGNPGFSFLFETPWTQANSAFDDFTDEESVGGTVPEITSLSDSTLTHGQTGVVISLTGGSASGNTVLISPTDVEDALAVSQPITAEDADEITLGALDLDSFDFGATLYLFVLNEDDEANEVGEPLTRVIASATLNLTLRNESGALVASQSSITLKVWRADTPAGAYSQEITGLSTNGSGVLSTTISLGSLDSDDYVCWFAYRGSPASQFGAGRSLPIYA